MSQLLLADMVSGATTTIQRPIDVVWPQLLDLEAWMKDFTITRMEGEKNREGELRRVVPTIDPSEASTAEVLPFYFKTLRLVPFHKFVYKAYTENRAGEYGFTGIEVLSLRDVGRATLVIFEVYLEFQSDVMSEARLGSFVREIKEGSSEVWERNFQRLSALLSAP